MIGYLKGKILSATDGCVILETNGIGFEITCSASVFAKLVNQTEGELFIYTAVKEDGISLYGFIDTAEKNMFLKLISISGVGPKMAITVLSSISINDLAIKIASSDVKGLSKIKGLGKKTAERIILELRESVGKIDADDVCDNKQEEIDMEIEKENKDIIIALMSLGFTKAESSNAIKKARESGVTNVNELIALALKNIR